MRNQISNPRILPTGMLSLVISFPRESLSFPPPIHCPTLADIVDSTDIGRETPISAGFYRLQPGPELVYTYTYDEMKILVDGDMQISQLKAAPAKDGEEKEGEVELVKEEVDAKKGDTFFFPKGAVVRFRTRDGGLAWFCGQRGRDAA